MYQAGKYLRMTPAMCLDIVDSFVCRCRYGPPTRTEYRLTVENLSSRVSWQVRSIRFVKFAFSCSLVRVGRPRTAFHHVCRCDKLDAKPGRFAPPGGPSHRIEDSEPLPTASPKTACKDTGVVANAYSFEPPPTSHSSWDQVGPRGHFSEIPYNQRHPPNLDGTE